MAGSEPKEARWVGGDLGCKAWVGYRRDLGQAGFMGVSSFFTSD